MKILITGTHFTPAQALIEQFNKVGGQDVIYVGRKSTREGDKTKSIEAEVLPKLGVRFVPIVSGRLSRNFSIWTLTSLLKLPIGFLQSFWVVVKEQPDVVVSFGGYLAFPVVFWSWWLNIPVVIHEQTLSLGLANWMSVQFASKVALSFPIKSLLKNSKVEITGNPIREQMLTSSKPSKEIGDFLKTNQKLPLLLVVGGNQGSHFINRLVGKTLGELTKQYVLIHQTGDSKFQDYEYLDGVKSSLPHSERYLIAKWIESSDLSAILEKADLVISRAGMNTLYELALRKKVGLIIPIPMSVGTEQTKNAKFFAKAQMGDFMSQGEASEQEFLYRIQGILKKLDSYYLEDNQAIFLANGAQKLSQLVLGIKSTQDN